MPKTTPCPTCPDEGAPLIVTRRSCPGCGMNPGKLHNNGLCVSCQHPAPEIDYADNTGTVTRVGVVAPDEETAVAAALDHLGRGDEYDSVDHLGGDRYEVVVPR